MEAGFQGKLLERNGVGMLGEDVQQLHHAVDDLNGVFAFGCSGSGVDLLGGHGSAQYEHSMDWQEFESYSPTLISPNEMKCDPMERVPSRLWAIMPPCLHRPFNRSRLS
ncbi:hypothetical protein [Thauera sp. SDU_THAU2]|uniref:hypothetical protein n=1 Tax=Thauera sp. SDU_THAU2 TaxID=3136633 RepID=UPI00311E56F1